MKGKFREEKNNERLCFEVWSNLKHERRVFKGSWRTSIGRERVKRSSKRPSRSNGTKSSSRGIVCAITAQAPFTSFQMNL